MAISGDYSQPVQVNGYSCKNCTDVDNAKKHIDPAHPRSGPYDVNAATDPSRKFEPAVVLGGALANSASGGGRGASRAPIDDALATKPFEPGRRVDIAA